MSRLNDTLVQFRNCRILREGKIINEDLWVRDGKIIDPEKVFYDEKIKAETVVDCQGAIISSGFIDLQINGGFGIDFSEKCDKVEQGVGIVAKGLLAYGVTSFCPTVVTSPPETYRHVLPRIKKREGGKDGATVLGVHVEGPFISPSKKGAHQENCISKFDQGLNSLIDMYGSLENICYVTLAPEIPNACSVIKELRKKNIMVSVGHSVANLKEGEEAVRCGASFITHLFNAMLPVCNLKISRRLTKFKEIGHLTHNDKNWFKFIEDTREQFHHRDPGLVGLLTSDKIPSGMTIHYGIIADGVHTHPAALRIAHRTHPQGLVLVTDAIAALGLKDGTYRLGQLDIEVEKERAYIVGTNTLCGSTAGMANCVRHFREATGCTIVEALEAATRHPARALGIDNRKGVLNFGADADLVMLDNDLKVMSTWIAGQCVYSA